MFNATTFNGPSSPAAPAPAAGAYPIAHLLAALAPPGPAVVAPPATTGPYFAGLYFAASYFPGGYFGVATPPIIPSGGSLDLSDQSPTTNLFVAYLAAGNAFPISVQLQRASDLGGVAGPYSPSGVAIAMGTLSRTANLEDTPPGPPAAHWYRATFSDSATSPSLATTAGLLVAPLIASDESGILRDVATRLQATGCFDEVLVSESADATPATSYWAAYAVVWHKGGDDLDDAMSYGSPDTIRHATYGVMIEVADLESGDRSNELTRLIAKAKTALNHQSLAGATLPAWTMIRGDARNAGSQPRGRATLSGEYAFISSADYFATAYE